jgi:DEAD/DEAH box helicase domain-containing protein
MRRIVFDIETRNIFQDVGSNDPTKLDISVVGIYDSETDSYATYLQEELNQLWPVIERADILIGFYSEHFDLPLLNKYYPGDLGTIPHIDILKEIRKQYGRGMKLDQLAEGTLGIRKSGHGLDAIKWWRKGEVDKIRAYCADDVKITKELYDYALANGKLMFKEGPQVKEIPLDTSAWEKTGDNKMTFSMPF